MKEFGEFLIQNFGYPFGGLYSNLIASALLALGGYITGRKFAHKAEANHERRHQEVLEAHHKTHELLDKKKRKV